LRFIKALRNLFAHAEMPVRFASPEVIDKARKFPQKYPEGADVRMSFDTAVQRAEVAIDNKIHGLLYGYATTV
jgi:hypothetical protein